MSEAGSERPRRRASKRAVQEHELFERIKALEENQRRSMEFLGVLGHELRNPLAPMRNSLHYLKLACGSNADMQEALGIVERQINVFVRLLDDLRDVSRIDRDNIKLQKEKESLAGILRSAVAVCQRELVAAEQQLAVNLSAESIYVEADATRLVQAFAKLLRNAAKYSEPGGHVTIRCEVGEESVTVHVIDTGIGIEAGMLEEIFNLFRQLNDPRARTLGGLGIGLPVAREIIRLHGGTIEAQSEGSGKGSDFAVKLPIFG